MAWDSGTSDNVSRRSTAQSDVAPRTVNRRVLRSDDALFTYSDKALLPVADRGFLGHLLSTLVSQSADYTLLDSDGDYMEVDPGAADKTITLPTVADNDGRTIMVRHIGTGAGGGILDGEGDEEVNGAATFTLPDGGSVVVLRCNGTSWTWIGGHIVGSNANGTYVVFSSGLQVCLGQVTGTGRTTQEYPASFAAAPYCMVNYYGASDSTFASYTNFPGQTETTHVGIVWRLVSDGSLAVVSRVARYIAIGLAS